MITTRNYSLLDGEKGILLVFPQVPTSLPNEDIYIIEFEVASTLPTLSPPQVTFIPNNPSYTLVRNKNFSPTVNIKITASHTFETRSLIRAIVKDQNQNILYTNYVWVICAPPDTYSFEATLENNPTAIEENSTLKLLNSGDRENLSIGMKVSGPGIPATTSVFIKSFSETDPNVIELTANIEIENDIRGFYTFLRVSFCPTPEELINRETQQNYLILNKENNWTFSYADQIMAKFIKSENTDDKIQILLPIKNVPALIVESGSAPIPFISEIYGAGRVSYNGLPLVDLS